VSGKVVLTNNFRCFTCESSGAILQILEQRYRARPPANKAPDQADARVQAIRDGGGDDSGIELAEKIKKQQFNLKPLTRKATTLRNFGQQSAPPKSARPSRQDKNIHARKFAPEPDTGGSILKSGRENEGNCHHSGRNEKVTFFPLAFDGGYCCLTTDLSTSRWWPRHGRRTPFLKRSWFRVSRWPLL
jgi:hypothetical protein